LKEFISLLHTMNVTGTCGVWCLHGS